MRKKRDFVKPWDWNTWQKMLIIPKLFVGLLGMLFLAMPFDTYAQERTKVTLDLKNVTLNEMFEEMKKQTDYDFFYNSQLLRARGFISVKADNEEVTSVLDRVLPGVNLEYQMNNNLVTIRAKKVEQQQQVNFVQVKGRVTDEKGNPLPGAAVIIHGTTQGVSTDMEGHYTLNVKPDDVLKFSFIGYKEEVRPVQGQTTINVGLQPTAENLEEVQVVAFGTQKKESVVSAITTIRPTELRSSSSDLTTQLTGKIAGIVGWQTGGLPGALMEDEMNTQFYVRGVTSFMGSSEPLILLDGVETSRVDLARVPVEDIESFSVLKDALATAMYGARGANGVIMLTTKKGEEGSVYTSVRYEAVFSEPTRKIDVVDPITYMRMYNRALLSRTPGATPKYSVERINRTQSGKYPSFVYPANDWYDILFKDYSVNHRAGISLRGGSKLIQYYASLNYNRDVGMIKTDQLNDFDCNIINNQYSFRTNLTIDLKAGIQLLINSSATIDKYNGPLESQEQAYYAAFSASPTDFAPTYPGDDTYNWPHIRFGKENEESKNPYLEIQKGYVERTRYSTINRAEYIQNLSSLVKGLELRASVSYSQTGLYASSYSSTPYEYALKEYDFEMGKHTLEALNADRADRTLTLLPDYPLTESQMTYELRLLHTAAWGEHQTSLTGVAQMQEQTSGGSNQDVLEAMPRRNMTFSMRGTYGYKNRYFAEASFGYNGSERFAEGNRFGFFPSVGAAWVISNEPFMQSVYNWSPYLKLRASWGQVGNDGIIETPRFVFLPDIKTREGAYVDPSPGGGSIQRYYISSYPNDNINPNRSLEIVLTPSLMTDWGLFPRVAGNVVQYHGDLEFRRAELYL